MADFKLNVKGVKPKLFNNSLDVKEALRRLIRANFGTHKAFAEVLGIKAQRLSYIFHDRAPLDEDFLRLVKKQTGHEIGVDGSYHIAKPPEANAGAAPARQETQRDRVLVLVDAVNALDTDDAGLVVALVEFRMGRPSGGVSEVLAAVGSIATIRDLVAREARQ